MERWSPIGGYGARRLAVHLSANDMLRGPLHPVSFGVAGDRALIVVGRILPAMRRTL